MKWSVREAAKPSPSSPSNNSSSACGLWGRQRRDYSLRIGDFDSKLLMNSMTAAALPSSL